MPNLQKILEGNDLGFFRIVANFWGIEMTAPDGYTALNSLLNEMRSPRLTNEIIEALPAEARTALQALWENEGHLLWAQFCRLFGEVRDMGPARRDRERPDLHPVSPAEVLWRRCGSMLK